MYPVCLGTTNGELLTSVIHLRTLLEEASCACTRVSEHCNAFTILTPVSFCGVAFRHDMKIKTSDEGRVMKTAAAFAKGLLELEGELMPILYSLVHKDKGEQLRT